MTTLLGIFAKHWTPGRVKTRLASNVGERLAAEIHREFVQTLLMRFESVADCRVLAFDPPASEHEFQSSAGPAWEVRAQGAGDLGVRMAEFFEAGLARAQRVVLIGSDSPDLPVSYVAEAFEVLGSADVVLGPASDGGYYLVGAAGPVPPIFSDIPWSTAYVWPQTIAQLSQAGLRWHALSQWYDVDTEDDLLRLRSNLSAPCDVHLKRLAEALDALLAKLQRPSM
jgi:rSAM/selenodomain-associated transferase 1